MPMIRGRYYMNPALGEAIEQARSLGEGNFQNQEQDYEHSSDEPVRDERGRFRRGHSDERDTHHGRIHRVEIERAEFGSDGDGRSSCGFLARIHRHEAAEDGAGENGDAGRPWENHRAAFPSRPFVHVFTDHHGLLDFLRNEFSREE